MDAASFRALVQRLETGAAARPRSYTLRVAALAVLGYGYVLGMVVLLAAATVAFVVVGRGVGAKFALPLIVVIGVALRALWVTLPAPQGVRLEARDAPALFSLVETLRRRLRAPRTHAILVVPEVNAAIVQIPRLGMFGWHKNHLLVGLPLLQTVTPEEWQAVLAHELGHLSGNHGRFAAWIYRMRATWGRLLEEFERRRNAVGQVVFGAFFRWYVPYFNAYTFVLARAHEYAADAAAAEVTGSETARRALIRTELGGQLADGFWSALHGSAADTPDAPGDPYARLRAALAGGASRDDAAAWLGLAWRRPTDYADTHPSLADRLRALGAPPGEPEPPPPLAGPTAAVAYLGGAAAAIERKFDQSWQRQAREPWQARYRECREARERLAALDARPAGATTADEEWERVQLCATLGDREGADAHAGVLLALAPDHAPAHLYVGQRLLERGDPRGVEHVERGMRDPVLILPGCGALFQYHWARGEVERAERYREMAARRQAELREARAERLHIPKDVQLVPHDLSPEQVAALRERLEQVPALSGAAVFLARRIVRLVPEQPCYVVGIAPRTAWWRLRSRKREIALRHAVAQRLPGFAPFYAFLLVDGAKRLRKKFERLEKARVM